jgi:hypothetical protein
MKYVFMALVGVGALVFLAAPATADWKEGDPDKMHFPQLPDPNGWDVKFGPFVDLQGIPGIKVLADDWLCTETGPVKDVHFWFSAKYGEWHPAIPIQNIHVSIWSNQPKDATGAPSKPKELLWWADLDQGELRYKIAGPFTGVQGWYDPNPPIEVLPENHNTFWQANIDLLKPPFEQKRGEIYWLDLYMVARPPNGMPVELGWKTADTNLYPPGSTGNHFMDDAFYGHLAMVDGVPFVRWIAPLSDPRTGESLDMAFVITPEPGTVVMLVGAGLIGLAAYARRRRNR